MYSKVKEKINNLLADGKGAIFAIFLLEFILAIFITPDKFDDATFIESVTNNSILNYVTGRYSNWSSRVIIEFTLCFVLKTSKYLWIIIQSAMMAIIGYSISKLFIKENKKELNYMILFMILIYPFNVMASAGWAATTTNYMWPLATALFCLIPIQKVWNKEKIKNFTYPLYILSLLYACNQEQTCAIVCGTYLLYSLFFILKDKKIHPFIVFQTILSIASLIFILTCPGNYVRKDYEISNIFPDFEELTILDKVSVGLTSTFGELIGHANLPFVILSLIIAVYIFIYYKEKLYRVIALIPLITVSVLGVFIDIIGRHYSYFPAFREILLQEDLIYTVANCDNLMNIFPLMMSFVILICMSISILIIFKNLKSNIAILIFFIGLASRLIIGFSPTIFASGVRTMIFFEFAMLIVGILIWQEFIKKTDKIDRKVQGRLGAIIKCASILQYANVLLCVLFTK